MSRWIAAVFVISAALVLSFAQDSGDKPLRFPLGGSKSLLPFDLVEVDGQKAWRIVGRGNVKLEELMAGYTSATGKRVSYDSSASDASRYSLLYVGPDDGMVIKQGELGDYVSELLEATGLTLVGHSTNRARVVRMDAAAGYAVVVEPAALSALPDSEWVTVSHVDLQTETNALRRHLQHFSKSQVYVTADDGVLTATGRVAQIRNLEALLSKLEAANAGTDGMEVRSYDVGATKPADAARVLNELFDESGSTVQKLDGNYSVHTQGKKRVNVSVAPTGNRVLVRANSADHELVKAALAALK